ncbi:SIMPL domain-containing protein [Lentzea nigeriaca]|uniref:SIMPL domain-containing protein n=1 Tax=Lentzea nigeriaca TaxID=1128665 RepID=UPI001957BB00|nr:SIMPL domain-containing protein [Lentzea nigeriaca]MBM7865113.1 uncharacterized protein YggE [Lentzea nigeriaca]
MFPFNDGTNSVRATPSALRRLVGVGALAVACLVTVSVPAQAAESGTVAVSGHGKASAVPDLAVISVGVEVRKPTATEAEAAQSTAARALLEAVRAQGVSDRDIRTENMWLNPVYESDQAGGNSHLAGFQAGQAFTVKVRDVSRTGTVLHAAVAAAGDAGRINWITFDLEDRAALRHQARAAAFKNAHDAAAQYAELSGHRLGDLVSVNEAAAGGASPVQVLAQAADSAQVPVAPGQIKDEVVVDVVYRLR